MKCEICWIKEIEQFLFDGSISEVVVRIKALSTQFSEVQVILERKAHYFENMRSVYGIKNIERRLSDWESCDCKCV